MPHDSLFLQIHTLTGYAASLLNRDDVGRAKRMPYGGFDRVRVSSQCLKRHWREAVSDWSLEAVPDLVGAAPTPGTVRSRKIISREIARPLVDEEKFPVADVVVVLNALKAVFLGKNEKKNLSTKKIGQVVTIEAVNEPPASDDGLAIDDLDRQLKSLDTKQVIVLGRPEIEFIRQIASDILREGSGEPEKAVEAHLKRKETRENLGALRLACGLDAALFGRMVTSDILARGDGALHVAHALTVHAEEAEPDYFVAVDDLTREAGELGTGLIQTAELTSGLFYGYVVVDVPQLVSNLEGVEPTGWRQADHRLARGTIERLVHLIATTSPGAKRGSTAPYAYADLVLVEAGRRQPRSLMAAFHDPVAKRHARQGAVDALARHLRRFDEVYGGDEDRRVLALLDTGAVSAGPIEGGLGALARWAAGRLEADDPRANADAA